MFNTKPYKLLFILCIISFTSAAHSTTLDTHDIAVDSRGNIFIGTEGEGVYRSIDNGETIEQAGLEGLDVEVIAVNSEDYIFAGTEVKGIYRSTDGGDTWTVFNNGLPEICGVWSIAFVSEEIIVAGATEGAFLSNDCGENWINIGFTDIMIREVVITPEGDILVVAQHDGIYRTGDFGDTWELLSEETKDIFITQLVVSSQGAWFAGTWGDGVYRSTDNGLSWIKTSYGMGDAYINYLALDSEDNVYAGVHGPHLDYHGEGVYRSTDRGNNWFPVYRNSGISHVKAIAFHPDGIILLGSWYARGVYLSTDGGESWVHSKTEDEPDPRKSITIYHPRGGEELENGSQHDIIWNSEGIEIVIIEYSADNGLNWHVITDFADACEGLYTWTVSGIESDEYLIRVSDATDPDVYDISDGTFSVIDHTPLIHHFIPEVSNTGNNATILLLTENPPAINGIPIEIGDEIGVFSPRGECCGSGVWEGQNLAITVWGDDSQEDGVRGFVTGELMTIKILDVSELSVYLASAVYERGDGIFIKDGIYIVSSLETPLINYTIPLIEGWNCISSPLIPEYPSMETITAGAGDNLVMLKNGSGKVYWPSYAVNQIGDWKLTDGYQVYMNEPAHLVITGYELFIPDIIYNLPEGWSLISYVGQDGMNPSDAFESILDKVVIIKDGTGKVFWPEYDISQFESMNRGKGYWLYLNKPAEFSFPVSVAKPSIQAHGIQKYLRHFIPVTNTGNNATILVRAEIEPAVNGEPLSTLDEIGIFTPSGLCAGAGVWNEGKNLAITVWGDNIQTDRKDGMSEDEKYRFKIWIAESEEVYDAAAILKSAGALYTPNGIVILESLTGGDMIVPVEDFKAPSEFSLSQNFPNPFNPVTVISFSLPYECSVNLTVYNVAGKKIAVIVDNVFSAGAHSVEWDAGEFSSGIYFYRIEAGTFTSTKKLMLIK